MQFDTALRNAILAAVRDQFDAGTPPATMEVRTGAKPAALTDADTGTVLSTHTLGNPSAGTPANASLAFTINADPSADASGTPGYVVIRNGGTATARARFPAGVGSGEFNFNSTISLGGNVSATLTLTGPNA